jgi:hypothetical protein
MDIRKIIKEELSMVFESDDKGIKGLDILNHFPFSDLPETRKDSDWKVGVSGWGKVYVPSVESPGSSTQIASNEDFVYREVKGPKMIHKIDGYIIDFKNKFGEEPIFKINPNVPKHEMIEILNTSFKNWRKRYYELRDEEE